MRRYICPKRKLDGLDAGEKYDVVIVGSGIAGMYASLHLDDSLKVALITKVDIETSNSWYAQGGIAAVIAKQDNSKMHIEDTLKAGAGLCKQEAVEVLVAEGPENIRELQNMDVPFDVDADGELQITREGGHRLRRIVHCGGDATGKETTKRLGEIVMQRRNIDVLFHTFLVDIVSDTKSVQGVIICDAESGKYTLLHSQNVIIATGGLGQLYNYTTNPVGAVGDGIACAYRAGARLRNMEMIQFHPTTLVTNENTDRLFLISEAVRGEGAVLRNKKGEAFMQGKHPMADLAPRDIVTREILKELRRTGDDCALLDCTAMTGEFFSKRFPTIFSQCEKFGIHLTEDYIPVHPAQHYFMGGIETDLDGMTNIEGLYACGEAACTGIHGANRLASNSMLECLVFGRRCARHINASRVKARSSDLEKKLAQEIGSVETVALSKEQISAYKREIKNIMSDDFGAMRNAEDMQSAKHEIERIISECENMECDTQDAMELYNMMEVAHRVAIAALARKTSVGAHYIESKVMSENV